MPPMDPHHRDDPRGHHRGDPAAHDGPEGEVGQGVGRGVGRWEDTADLLGALRGAPLDEDDGAAFKAGMHRRLVAAGAPQRAGVLDAVRHWLSGRPLLVGTAAGTCAGAAAFGALLWLSPPFAAPTTTAGTASIAAPGGAGRGGAGAGAACAPEALAAHGAMAGPKPALARDPGTAGGQVRTQAEVFVVPAGKVAMVQLHFAVPDAVGEAEFSVLLPGGLSFFSDGEALARRSFHWVAPLAAGDNAVPIAVVGRAPGRHRITATATVAGEVVVHEVVLDVQEPV